jgi:hypothetical protein
MPMSPGLHYRHAWECQCVIIDHDLRFACFRKSLKANCVPANRHEDIRAGPNVLVSISVGGFLTRYLPRPHCSRSST